MKIKNNYKRYHSERLATRMYKSVETIDKWSIFFHGVRSRFKRAYEF